jgi:hypothetical protein
VDGVCSRLTPKRIGKLRIDQQGAHGVENGEVLTLNPSILLMSIRRNGCGLDTVAGQETLEFPRGKFPSVIRTNGLDAERTLILNQFDIVFEVS